MSGTHQAGTIFVKTVLLVEDNDDDVFFMKSACESSGVPHSLIVLTDGQAAMDYLSGALESRSKSALPDLVVLDVKLPKVNGHDVLKWLRMQPALKQIPVVMLTSSIIPTDCKAAYDLGATSYFHKRADVEHLNMLVKTLLDYWFQVNPSLPSTKTPGGEAGLGSNPA